MANLVCRACGGKAEESQRCPDCQGEAGAMPDGSWKCIAAVGRFIGCGWHGPESDLMMECTKCQTVSELPPEED